MSKDIKTRQLHTLDTLRYYKAACLEHRKIAYATLLLPVANVIMSVGVPFYASKVLAELIGGSEDYMTDFYTLCIIAMSGVLINKFAIKNSMRLQPLVMSSLGRMAYNRLLARSAAYHSNNISGKLVSDVSDFYDAFGLFFTSAFIKGLSFLSIIVVGLTILFFSSWQLGLTVFIVLVGLSSWVFIDSKRRSNLRLNRLAVAKELTSHSSDTIVNILNVKTFASEEREKARYRELSGELSGLQQRDWVQTVAGESYRVGLVVIMQLLIIYILIQLVQKDPGVLAAGIFAFTYTLTLLNRFFEINTITRQVEESLLKASSMSQMLKEEIEIQDSPDAKKLVIHAGEIKLDDVTFAYENQNHESGVFKNLSLTIKPGEKVGIVGPSGGGKSTLTRLLMRFEDVNSGAILIDNQNISNVTQSSLRSSIAYVSQEPLLFHRTIRENIAYGDINSSKESIISAAKKANAHDFIMSLPKGYETVVGERGIKLSGGQRQRVAIARAILKNAPLLILDEATSALDSESEVLIQAALTKLMKGRTSIVIAHRLSTIQRMDRIIVIDNGKIVQEGSHKSLLSQPGIYSKLWTHQSGGFLED